MNLIQVYHFWFHIITCIEYKSKWKFSFLFSTFSEEFWLKTFPEGKNFLLAQFSCETFSSVYCYMAHIIWESNCYHYLNENHSFSMHESICFRFVHSFISQFFFSDNNRKHYSNFMPKRKRKNENEKSEKWRKSQAKERKLVFGTMLFYSDMKIFPCHTLCKNIKHI